jgi:hypothetical protein
MSGLRHDADSGNESAERNEFGGFHTRASTMKIKFEIRMPKPESGSSRAFIRGFPFGFISGFDFRISDFSLCSLAL